MKKTILSLLLFVTLFGCQNTEENADDNTTHADNIENAVSLNKFYLTKMEESRSDEYTNYSYEIDLLADSIVVKSSEVTIGLDGKEVQHEPQQLLDFENEEDGSITFSFEEEVLDDSESRMETRTVTFNRLSQSVYELEDGTRYELSEEEK